MLLKSQIFNNFSFKLILIPSIFCLILSFFLSEFVQNLLIFSGILSFGIIHGANDILLLKKNTRNNDDSSLTLLIKYLAMVISFGIFFILGLWFALYKTSWGLRSRAVGEHPSSADTAGVSVARLRYINVTIAGGIGALAGAYLSLELVGSFERGFTAGKGFTALALMIFGRWNPLGALAAALFFGLAQAYANQLMIDQIVNIPSQFTAALPYIMTIVVLTISAGKVRPPAAEGQPYEKGQA